jgi:transcription antitermination factor NusG
MPLLARQPDLFPEDLFAPADQAADQESGAAADWRVAHTLPRREKDLARRLLSLEIPYYLPQMEQQYRSPSGRRRSSFLPLFPGYLFLRSDDERAVEVQETGCIARLLPVADPEALLFDLKQIHHLTSSGVPLNREPRFAPGMRVRVVTGSFTGYEGQIVSTRSGDRLLVAIHYINQAISISLDGCQVEPADR